MKHDQTIVLEAATRLQIPYADKPLAEGGSIQNLSQEKLNKLLGLGKNFLMDESVYYDARLFSKNKQRLLQKARDDLNTYSGIRCGTLEAIEQRLKSPLQNLVVCKMVPDELGVGLFTNACISRGVLISVLPGVLEDLDECKRFGTHGVDDTLHDGISGFLQHLPEAGTEEIEVLSAFHSDLATSNLELISAIYNNLPVQLLVATRDIAANEILGLSYPESHWQQRSIHPQYFNKFGKTFLVSQSSCSVETARIKSLYSAADIEAAAEQYEAALVLFNSKQYEVALLHLNKMLDTFVCSKLFPIKQIAICSLTKAECLVELGQYQEALLACEQAFEMLTKENESDLIIKSGNLLKDLIFKLNLSFESLMRHVDTQFALNHFNTALIESGIASDRLTGDSAERRKNSIITLAKGIECELKLSRRTVAERLWNEINKHYKSFETPGDPELNAIITRVTQLLGQDNEISKNDNKAVQCRR